MSLVVVLDFDGTVTTKDIGDEVCDRFAPPAWRDIDAEWVRNEISLPEAQRRMWALARCSREEAVAFGREVGELRAGLDRFLDAAGRAGGRLGLGPGGVGLFLEGLPGGPLGGVRRA